jgi:DNA-binding transcriptional MerR regulator
MERKMSILLDDEELYDLFVDEAIRQGVRLESEDEFMGLLSQIQAKGPNHDSQMMVRVAVDMVREREGTPRRAPVPLIDKTAIKPPVDGVHGAANVEAPANRAAAVEVPVNRGVALEEKIIKKLGWNPEDPATEGRLDMLLERIRAAGIADPNSFLGLREACERTGIAERTLRRYVAEGLLPTEKVKGPRGPEHRVYVPRLFLVMLERSAAFERARSSPLEDMSREIAGLCRAIVEQQAIADRRTDRLLEEIRGQSRVIDELRAEQRDARAQIHVIQEQMIKALLPPARKSFLRRMFDWR